jgi:hypothetical protein
MDEFTTSLDPTSQLGLTIATFWGSPADQCFDGPDPNSVAWSVSDMTTNSGPEYTLYGLTLGDILEEGIGPCSGYDGAQLYLYETGEYGNSLTFRVPGEYPPDSTVLVTFTGIYYWGPSGYTMDLSQVTFQGQYPILWDNSAQTASYLVKLTGGQPCVISEGSFGWPDIAVTSLSLAEPCTDPASGYFHVLQFSGFDTVLAPTNIITVTMATTPPDRARRTIGVGEEVSLTLSPGCPCGGTTWSLSGPGTLSASGDGGTFTASDQQSQDTIAATCCGQSYSVSFNVIPPNGVLFTKSGGDKHLQEFTSAGFLAKVQMLPTSVSFYAIQVREDSAPLNFASGIWTNAGPHMQGAWEPINENNTLNTPDGDDHVSSTPLVPGVFPGGYSWSIPWRYAVDTSGTGYVFRTLDHVFSADSNGTATQSKNSVSTAPIPVNAPSTDWPF